MGVLWLPTHAQTLWLGWNNVPLFGNEMSIFLFTRWQRMVESFVIPCASNQINAHWWSMVSRMSSSKATAFPWSTTLRLSPLHVSHKLSPWLSERCVSTELESTGGSTRLTFCFLWLIVCMASCWRAAMYTWASADGPGWHCCLHDQGHLCRQHGWEQVWKRSTATEVNIQHLSIFLTHVLFICVN